MDQRDVSGATSQPLVRELPHNMFGLPLTRESLTARLNSAVQQPLPTGNSLPSASTYSRFGLRVPRNSTQQVLETAPPAYPNLVLQE